MVWIRTFARVIIRELASVMLRAFTRVIYLRAFARVRG